MPLKRGRWYMAVSCAPVLQRNHVQAASFVVDQWLLEQLCQLAGRRLFELPQHQSQMQSPLKLGSSVRGAAEPCTGDAQVRSVVCAHVV